MVTAALEVVEDFERTRKTGSKDLSEAAVFVLTERYADYTGYRDALPVIIQHLPEAV